MAVQIIDSMLAAVPDRCRTATPEATDLQKSVGALLHWGRILHGMSEAPSDMERDLLNFVADQLRELADGLEHNAGGPPKPKLPS